MRITPSYSLDDLLLVPKYSTIPSRSQIDTSVDLGKDVKLKIPILASPMPDVSGVDMANALGSLGGLTLLHRFNTIEAQVEMWKAGLFPRLTGAAIGVKTEDKMRATALVKAGCSILCVDVAHGWSTNCGDMVQWIAKTYPHVLIIAGSVATGVAAEYLGAQGADVIRCNIGSSGICTTKINTGNGVPSLTSLHSAFQTACSNQTYTSQRKFKILADGGLKNPGDLCKSLCFADAAILGNLLARTTESPAILITRPEGKYKQYRGASTLAGPQAANKSTHVEGVQGWVPWEGSVAEVVEKLMQGLRSGMSYQNAWNLEDLKIDPEFVQITGAGLTESRPHSILMEK